LRPLLATLTVLLALVLVWQWRAWPPPAPGAGESGPATSQEPAATNAAEDPLAALTPLPDKEDYAVVIERPLFMADRRPPSEEEENEPEALPEPLSDLAAIDLNAVLITPTLSMAWVRDPTSKTPVRKRVGDDLEGWSIMEILSDRILLERQGEKDTLILRDYENMPPPAPPPPPRRTAARRQGEQLPQEAEGGQAADGNPRAGQRPNPRGSQAAAPQSNGSSGRTSALQRRTREGSAGAGR